jgi:hypothetical protein
VNEPVDMMLGQFALSHNDRPTVVIVAGTEAVVLDHDGRTNVRIWQSDVVTSRPADTPVEAVMPPAQAASVIRRALQSLTYQYLHAIRTRHADAVQHRMTMQAIRLYAITKHRQHVFDRQALNDFLAEFELPLYEPRLKLTFTILGSYEVTATEAETARRQAVQSLAVTIHRIQHIDLENYRLQIEVRDVVSVSQTAQPRLRVEYQLTGTVKLLRGDLEVTRIEAQTSLGPDLSRLPDLVPDTALHDVDFEITVDRTQ